MRVVGVFADDVPAQEAAAREALGAPGQMTRKRLDRAVRQLVPPLVRAVRERLATALELAHERLFAGVRANMPLRT